MTHSKAQPQWLCKAWGDRLLLVRASVQNRVSESTLDPVVFTVLDTMGTIRQCQFIEYLVPAIWRHSWLWSYNLLKFLNVAYWISWEDDHCMHTHVYNCQSYYGWKPLRSIIHTWASTDSLMLLNMVLNIRIEEWRQYRPLVSMRMICQWVILYYLVTVFWKLSPYCWWTHG